MPVVEEILAALVSILVEAVGQEKAHQLISEEARRRAYIMADGVALGRIAAQKAREGT